MHSAKLDERPTILDSHSDVSKDFIDQKRHVKKHCEKRHEWMKAQKTSTAAAASSEHASTSRHCLYITQPSSVKLPRVFVDGDCDPTSGSAQRFVSGIDTGLTRTLVTLALMDRPNVEFSKATDSGENIVFLDGSPLPVLRVAKLIMSRMDGPQCRVVIPTMSVEALVMPDLSVVAADVLIGSDFVAPYGGLHLEYSDDGSLVGITFGRATMMDVDAEVAASTVESALPGSVCDVKQVSRHHGQQFPTSGWV